MAPPWSVWWKFNVISEVLTMRKGQAWPKRCTPVRWCCWVKRACAANTSWSLQDPAPPERMIHHHLACSPMLKYWGENSASARLRLVRPPLTCEALPEVCFHLSGGTLQSATAKDEAFPAPLLHATKGWLSSPASCSALMTLRLGELKNIPGRAKKFLRGLIRVSAPCFANKLQINCAYSLLSCLSW